MPRGRWLLCLALCTVVFAAPLVSASNDQQFPFELTAPGEGVAEITASAPGASWGRPGAEASVATVYLDGQYNQDIVVDHGSQPWTYGVFLGSLRGGSHELRIERNAKWSAPAAGLQVPEVHVRAIPPNSADYLALAHAPVLYARADTLGHFSDVPLLMWYEVFPEGAGEVLQYSVVFSNEDAGTPTPALMARWGRATDIEYVYRVRLEQGGHVTSETFQGFQHKDVRFRGRREGSHPFLLVATPNDVFADTGASELQYRLLPVAADLSQHSREELMDRFPWTYHIMAEELQREGKIRPFDVHAEEAVGDPRNYLYLEMDAENKQTGLVAWVKLRNESKWYSSNGGNLGLAISRSGWFRTTVELPPGTKEESMEFVAIECEDMRTPVGFVDNPSAGTPESILRSVSKAFLLDSDYRPGRNLIESHLPLMLHPGDMYTFVPLSGK